MKTVLAIAEKERKKEKREFLSNEVIVSSSWTDRSASTPMYDGAVDECWFWKEREYIMSNLCNIYRESNIIYI